MKRLFSSEKETASTRNNGRTHSEVYTARIIFKILFDFGEILLSLLISGLLIILPPKKAVKFVMKIKA